MKSCNSSDLLPDNREFGECSLDPSADSIWILTSTFIIFTMQSGFGLLESGSVSPKNEVNIMVKNAVDVVFGGFTYWMVGYGLSFGEDEPYCNPFNGWGKFFVKANEEDLGWVYSKFFFQASFATTATTIVSGAMAERTKLESYIVFSMLNTFVYCIPAHWIWGSNGWLHTMGVVDIAGAGPVHMVGGVSGFVATIVLKPRHDRYKSKRMPQMGSPTNALLGMFMLWWGWLGFNCGSTFGISGLKWKLAARSAVSTISASMSGGVVGLLSSYIVNKRTFDVAYLINGILGSLVGITATCAMVHPYEGFIIGLVGSSLTIGGVAALDKLKIDDPVGCVGTHAVGGIWSMIAAGLFARRDSFASELGLDGVNDGVFRGGGFHQLGIQMLAVVSITGWTLCTSFIFLKTIQFLFGLRIPLDEELLGADLVEHGIGNFIYDKKTKKVIELEPGFQDVMEHGLYRGRVSRRQSHAFGKHNNIVSSSAEMTLQNVTEKAMKKDQRGFKELVRRLKGSLFGENDNGLRELKGPERNESQVVSNQIRATVNGITNKAFQGDRGKNAHTNGAPMNEMHSNVVSVTSLDETELGQTSFEDPISFSRKTYI